MLYYWYQRKRQNIYIYTFNQNKKLSTHILLFKIKIAYYL